MSKNKNELSILEQTRAGAGVVTDTLTNAIKVHAGASALELHHDSDGKEYIKATFKLRTPKKAHNEIVINDVVLAQKIEQINNAFALGDVSSFLVCRLLADIADSDATPYGFDSVPAMIGAIQGKAKSTLANYKRIGTYFVNSDFTLRGAIPQECTISLLNQLLSFVTKEMADGSADIRNVETLFKSAILTPYMKQAEYKKVCNALTELMKVPSNKELYELNEQEIADFKAMLADIIKGNKPVKKVVEQEQEQEQEQASEVGATPQIIIAQSMDMLEVIRKNFEALGVNDNDKELVNTWIENLYVTLGTMLDGEQEQEQTSN